MRGKIELEPLIKELSTRRKDKKVVFTNGCFDILHVGHVKYLEEAKSKGDILVLGLNSDSSVQQLKGPDRPIQKENDRAYILSCLESVDYVILFSDETPYELIKAVQPDILVKGGDWQVDQIVGHDIVQANGGQVMSLQFVDGRSTTNIVNQIKQ